MTLLAGLRPALRVRGMRGHLALRQRTSSPAPLISERISVPMTESHIILKKNIYVQVVEQEEEHLWNNERPIQLRMGFWACWRFGDHCPATISSVYLIIRFPPCGQRHRVKFIRNCAG